MINVKKHAFVPPECAYCSKKNKAHTWIFMNSFSPPFPSCDYNSLLPDTWQNNYRNLSGLVKKKKKEFSAT